MNELSLGYRPTPNPMIICRQMEGESVLVHPQRGNVQVLNPAAAFIWSFVDGQHTVAEISTQLCEEYDVELEDAQADVLAFLGELRKKDLIR